MRHMENFRVKIAGSEEIVPILPEPEAIRKGLRQRRWKQISAQCYARKAIQGDPLPQVRVPGASAEG
jgi:hypothetical protein